MSVTKPPQDEDSKLSPSETIDGATRVDLGDDLLAEKTAVLEASRVSDSSSSSGSMMSATQEVDQLESARILASEGILEEAKRILRKLLLENEDNLQARALLDEVHELELKQIFASGDAPRGRAMRRELESVVDIGADLALRNLDRDLGLGFFDENGAETAAQLSLFKDRTSMEAFGDRMDRDFAAAPAEERVDLGIAFLEMGLPDLAVRHFRAAVQKLELESEEARGSLLSATSLLAYALIQAGRPFDASIAMQILLADQEIPREHKLDLIYMMGRAQSAMGKEAMARQWYAEAAELDPDYRDIQERLREKP